MIALNTNPESDDVLELLLACHERIRRFGAMALKLVELRPVPGPDLADAASRVHRYFSLALPLHVADEETSIRPRLEAAGERDIVDVLALLGDQHEAIESRLARLLPGWVELAGNPDNVEAFTGHSLEDTRALVRSFEEHLSLEEERFLPEINRLLSSEERAEIVREMRQRRRVTTDGRTRAV